MNTSVIALIAMIIIFTIAFIEGKSIMDCQKLGNSKEECYRVVYGNY